MRGQLILHETDLLAKGFLLATLSTSSILQDIYFLFVSLIDLVRVLATTGNSSAVAGYTCV